MRMIYVPAGLRRAIEALALSLPLAAFEVIVVKRAPWWRLPYKQMGVAVLFALAGYLLLSWFIAQGKKSSWYIVAAALFVWVVCSGWMSIRLHNTNLTLFTLFLAACSAVFLALLSAELSRSFIDPRMAWFEGLPRPIPGLQCDVAAEEGKSGFRVARLDREGVFVFTNSNRDMLSQIRKNQKQELTISFRNRSIQCGAYPVRYFRRGPAQSGIGFQFKNLAPDVRKNLGDFVESLHGEGYVS